MLFVTPLDNVLPTFAVIICRLQNNSPLTDTGIELQLVSCKEKRNMPPFVASMFNQRESRRFRPLKMKLWMNQLGAALKHAWLFLQVDQAHRACVKHTWANMADCDIHNVWVTAAPLLQGGSSQKGSIVCNVIHCNFYTEEIHVIKAVHISVETDL